MKKFLRALIPVFFATTIAFPVEAHAIASHEAEDIFEEHKNHSCVSDDYSLTLNDGICGLRQVMEEITGQPDTRVLFVTDPHGENVREAQVIVTIIGQTGLQAMQKAQPFKGGYLISARDLMPGQYRLEAEVVVDGWLLTEEFNFTQT